MKEINLKVGDWVNNKNLLNDYFNGNKFLINEFLTFKKKVAETMKNNL